MKDAWVNSFHHYVKAKIIKPPRFHSDVFAFAFDYPCCEQTLIQSASQYTMENLPLLMCFSESINARGRFRTIEGVHRGMG